MVDTLIQANDCLFQVKVADSFVSVLCFKSFTVTITTDEKETTTSGDGAFKTFDYKVLSWNASLNGGMRIPDGISPTNFDFVEYQKGFIPVEFRAAWIDPAGDIRTFRGVGIIKSNNLIANASQLADATVDILGTGEYFIGDTLDEFVNLTIISTGNDTAPAFIKFWLLNDIGDTIFLTDILPQASGSMLDNPKNITVPIPKGTWYFYYYVDTNTFGNNINVTAPPTYTANFNNGVTQFNTFPNDLYDFTADRTVTITLGTSNPGPGCVAPAITSYALPDAEQYKNYSASFPLSGTAPFNFTNVTKPSWMGISVQSVAGLNYIVFTGTPTATATGVTVSFDINNACGTASFSDTIDVLVSSNARPINWTFTESVTTGYGFRMYVNGALVVTTDVADSGTHYAFPGDTVEVHLIGVALKIKHLKVDDSVSGNLYDTTSGASFLSFSWGITLLHNYTVLAEGIN